MDKNVMLNMLYNNTGGESNNIVLVVVPTDELGGAESVLKQIVDAASSAGHYVHVVFMSKGDRGSWGKPAPKVVFHFIKANTEKTGAIKALMLLRALSQKYRISTAISSHIHINAYVGVLRRVRWLRCCRQVVRESTVFADRFSGWKMMAFKCLYNIGYVSADLVVCQTEYMKESLRRLIPSSVKWNIRVIPNPIDVDTIKERSLCEVYPDPSSFSPYIVSAGRLIKEKGFDLLIEAFSGLRESHPSLRLLILGEGSERENLNEKAALFEVSERVCFIGRVPNPMPYFKHAIMCVVCSRVEGFPNVLLEMIAVNSRVVSTRCADGIEGINGVRSCDVNSATKLNMVMKELLVDTARRDHDASIEELKSRNPYSYWNMINNI